MTARDHDRTIINPATATTLTKGQTAEVTGTLCFANALKPSPVIHIDGVMLIYREVKDRDADYDDILRSMIEYMPPHLRNRPDSQ